MAGGVPDTRASAPQRRSKKIRSVRDEYLTNRGDHIVRDINVESLCCTPETHIVLYVNYI